MGKEKKNVVYRAMKYHFKADESQRRLLSFLCHISKNIYNYALPLLYEDYDKNNRLTLTKYDLRKIYNSNDNFHIINTSTAMMSVFRAYENFSSFLALIRKNKGGHDVINRPRYLPKNGETTITTQSFNKISIDDKTYIKMPVSNDMRTGRIVNADINAALNILCKCSPDATWLRSMGITVPKRIQVLRP